MIFGGMYLTLFATKPCATYEVNAH